MVRLSNLSKVGFGAYRITHRNPEHFKALKEAIRSGVNLIDTSSNYMNGESESIIGSLTSREKKKLYIITKGGYINASDQSLNEISLKMGIPVRSIYLTKTGSISCYTRDFIKKQLYQSLRRINRSYIDSYLIHNPENGLQSTNRKITKVDLLNELKSTFEYLEEEVQKGTIRNYGVSSNTISANSIDNGISLNDLLSITKENRWGSSNFKVIQFPFNMVENPNHSGFNQTRDLVEKAKLNNLITISNRPLNAIHNNKRFRLATCPSKDTDPNKSNSERIIQAFVCLIQDHLKSIDINDDVNLFTPMSIILTSWMHFPNNDAVDSIFHSSVRPFLLKIFESKIPHKVLISLQEVRQVIDEYASINMNKDSQNLLKSIGYVFSNDAQSYSLSQRAVSHCLENGIDHVLVGMRKPAYVNDMKLFLDSSYESYSPKNVIYAK